MSQSTIALRLSVRAQKRGAARARRIMLEREQAKRDDLAAEEIAPAAQRNAVMGANGTVYRHARLRRDGVTFVRCAPIDMMSGVSTAQRRAAERLVAAWETGGRGVGMAGSAYDERVSGVARSGISDAVLASIGHQNRARDEYLAACGYCGTLFNVLQVVVLNGIDLSVWAAAQDWNPQVAKGFLLAALERLAAFYESNPSRQGLP